MKNLETKKLSREQMKSVLGGALTGGHCTGNINCNKDQYCADIAPETGYGYCKKKEVEQNSLRIAL